MRRLIMDFWVRLFDVDFLVVQLNTNYLAELSLFIKGLVRHKTNSVKYGPQHGNNQSTDSTDGSIVRM